MFTINHLIWAVICGVLLFLGFISLKKYRPTLQQVLNIACIGAIVSEVIKTFSVLQVVPSTDGSTMYLYMELGHLPFHLCSIQILFIFIARFAGDSKAKETLLAFMYPTCAAGAFLAILLPSIFTSSIDISQAFTHPLAYQYFLYHTMLILLGVYIPMSGEVKIQGKHLLSSLGILVLLAFVSLYLNSMFAVPTYVNGELVSVDYMSNFFFTQATPIGIALTEKWHWFVYYGIIVVIANVMLGAFYAPFMKKKDKKD
ncbi:MAG: hypothetical protein E7253_11220 [Lachnospiraceae bacterium]|nr:hypothetical protein [Lachnospiraceae bacterium]